MRILIDGDSCPVLDTTIVLGQLLNIPVVAFSTMDNHTKNRGITHVRCKQGKDSVDYKILANLENSDVVVTQDGGLASLVLIKGARAINEYGFVFSRQFFQEKNTFICLRKGKQPQRRLKDDLAFIHGFFNLVACKIVKKEAQQKQIFLDNPSKAVLQIGLAISHALDYPLKIITRRQDFHLRNSELTVWVEDVEKKEEAVLPYLNCQDIVVTKDIHLAVSALQNGAAVLCENDYIYRLEDFEIAYQRGEPILINRQKDGYTHEQKFLHNLLAYCSPYGLKKIRQGLVLQSQETVRRRKKHS